MDFIGTLLVNKDDYPEFITDEIIEFCRSVFDDGDISYVIENTEITTSLDALLIKSKTNNGEIDLMLRPKAQELSPCFNLEVWSKDKGRLVFGMRKNGDKTLVDSYAVVFNEDGYYRLWNQGDDILSYVFYTRENLDSLTKKFGDNWRAFDLTQDEIPYERDDLTISQEEHTQIAKDFYLYPDLCISSIKSKYDRK